MKIKVLEVDHHRNGVGGEPFDVVLFEDSENDGTFVGILFAEPLTVAVLNIDKLSNGDIAFGSNSWRGDRYEGDLREAVRKHYK